MKKKKKIHHDIVKRWEGNPMIVIEDLSFKCNDILNASAFKIKDEYVLLITIENLDGSYSIYPAKSADGYDFDIADKPILERSSSGPFSIYEGHGIQDVRITMLEDEYYLCYNACGSHGYCTGLAKTKDFKSIERIGIISQPDTKGTVLFPEKINGRYARLERPNEGGSIWISYSNDLLYWGWSEVVMTPRGGFWDSNRIGPATTPYKTDVGWLIVYYGVKETSAGPLFRLGAAILDTENPTKIIERTNIPILSPRKKYERIGDVPNVVFTCGAIIEDNNEMKIYYGASNSCICVGLTKIDSIINACMESEKEY